MPKNVRPGRLNPYYNDYSIGQLKDAQNTYDLLQAQEEANRIEQEKLDLMKEQEFERRYNRDRDNDQKIVYSRDYNEENRLKNKLKEQEEEIEEADRLGISVREYRNLKQDKIFESIEEEEKTKKELLRNKRDKYADVANKLGFNYRYLDELISNADAEYRLNKEKYNDLEKYRRYTVSLSHMDDTSIAIKSFLILIDVLLIIFMGMQFIGTKEGIGVAGLLLVILNLMFPIYRHMKISIKKHAFCRENEIKYISNVDEELKILKDSVNKLAIYNYKGFTDFRKNHYNKELEELIVKHYPELDTIDRSQINRHGTVEDYNKFLKDIFPNYDPSYKTIKDKLALKHDS